MLAADIWIGGSGDWSNANHWSAGVPTNTSDVTIIPGVTVTVSSGSQVAATITSDATDTLSITGGSLTIGVNSTLAGNLSLSSGTLTSNEALVLSGANNQWSGGTISGSGSVAVAGGATLTLTGSGNKILNTATLNNSGTILDNGTNWGFGFAATVNNLSGGVINIATGDTLFYNGGVTSVVHNQAGAIFKDTASADVTINIAFNNDPNATIQVDNGILNLNGGGTSTGGTFDVASGATLAFSGGTHNLTGTYDSSGSAPATISGGNVTIGATGATFNNGPFAFTGGTTSVDAGGTLTLTGSNIWSGGTISGSGSVAVAGGATLTLTGSGNKILNTATLNNSGTILDNGTNWGFGFAATVNNLSGGVINIATGDTLFYNGGVTSVVHNQAGAIFKDTASADVTINIAFNNDPNATIQVDNGILNLNGGLQSPGNLTVGPGSLLDVNGNLTLSSTSVVTVQLAGPANSQIGRITVGGTATLAGTLDVKLVNNFLPNQGDSFPFFSPQSIAGQFNSVVNANSGSTTDFSAQYSPSAASIVVNASTLTVVDLAITAPSGPSQVVAGSAGTATWTVTNQGNASTNTGWNDAVFLSTDDELDPNDIQLVLRPNGPPTVLGPNGSYQASATFTIPANTAAGNYFLLIEANSDQAQNDTDFENNLQNVSVQILAHAPYVQVTGLLLDPANNLKSGDSLVVHWNDSNSGTDAVSNSFSDQVKIVNTSTGVTYLSTVVPYDETSLGPIASGNSAARQFTFQLPAGVAGVGNIDITVTNDINNQIPKFNADGTPEISSTTTIHTSSTLGPIADLAASNVTATTPGGSGQQVAVAWTLTNEGDATAAGPWVEEIFLAADSSGSNPTLLSSTTFNGQLSAGQSMLRTALVQLPQSALADERIIVHENATGSLFETNTNNNVAISAQSLHNPTSPAVIIVNIAESDDIESTTSVVPTTTVNSDANTASLSSTSPQRVLLVVLLPKAPAVAAPLRQSGGGVPPRVQQGFVSTGTVQAIDVVFGGDDVNTQMVLTNFLDFADPEALVIDLGDEPPATITAEAPKTTPTRGVAAHDDLVAGSNSTNQENAGNSSNSPGGSVTVMKPATDAIADTSSAARSDSALRGILANNWRVLAASGAVILLIGAGWTGRSKWFRFARKLRSR